MLQAKEVMSQERLDCYIEEAAKAVGYEGGFGVRGCDLSLVYWCAVYVRQSLKEQAENDRAAEYLLTCARMSKQLGVVVPREYVIYDADSSEHLGRPGISRLRHDLVAGRRISGVIIPALGRLSMDNLHRETFERECQYYGVRFFYGDAPSDMEWWSRAARSQLSFANEVRVTSNRGNPIGGNKSRCLTGKVPAGRAPYGYKYRREAEIDQRGKVKVMHAWWDVDEFGPDGRPIAGSPTWVVQQIFNWIGNEGRSEYWIINKLNDELGVKSPEGEKWAPSRITNIIRREAYTGNARYNKNGRFPNPTRPLGDLTLGIRRTIVRPKPDDGKPENERATFKVPPLVDEDLWQRANNALDERGRGRGKQGKTIRALFRNRMLCPVCERPMSVMRDRRGHVYYYCPWRYHHWVKQPCTYSRLVPARWDEELYDQICAMLRDKAWVEAQLTEEIRQDEGVDRLIRLELWKISQAQAKIDRIQDAYESSEPGKSGAYSKEEAERRITRHREAIIKAQQEVERLQKETIATNWGRADIDALERELATLRERNLSEASFKEKEDLVAKLGIKVYPSQDLKSRRIACRLNLSKIGNERERENDYGKVSFGSPSWIRTNNLAVNSRPLYR